MMMYDTQCHWQCTKSYRYMCRLEVDLATPLEHSLLLIITSPLQHRALPAEHFLATPQGRVLSIKCGTIIAL